MTSTHCSQGRSLYLGSKAPKQNTLQFRFMKQCKSHSIFMLLATIAETEEVQKSSVGVAAYNA